MQKIAIAITCALVFFGFTTTQAKLSPAPGS